MTWRRVGVIYAALAVLALAFVLLERAPERTPAPDDPGRPERSLLGTESERVRALVLRRDGRTVEARQNGGRWQVVAPPGAEVPSDLLAAAVATLTAGQAAEVMDDDAHVDLATFGLTEPTSEIEVTIDGEAPRRVRILLGARNPTRTAVYAKRDDAPTVYLIGLNVRYYEDLIFEAIATVAARP